MIGDAGVPCCRERLAGCVQPSGPRALEIGHGLAFRLENFRLIALRGLRMLGVRREEHSEAFDVRQPAPGKHAVARREILPECVDDVGDRLVVGRGRDDHGRLAPVERSLYREPRHRRKEHGRLARTGRAIHRDHLARLGGVEPRQNLPLVFGQGEMRVRMPEASRELGLDPMIQRIPGPARHGDLAEERRVRFIGQQAVVEVQHAAHGGIGAVRRLDEPASGRKVFRLVRRPARRQGIDHPTAMLAVVLPAVGCRDLGKGRGRQEFVERLHRSKGERPPGQRQQQVARDGIARRHDPPGPVYEALRDHRGDDLRHPIGVRHGMRDLASRHQRPEADRDRSAPILAPEQGPDHLFGKGARLEGITGDRREPLAIRRPERPLAKRTIRKGCSPIPQDVRKCHSHEEITVGSIGGRKTSSTHGLVQGHLNIYRLRNEVRRGLSSFCRTRLAVRARRVVLRPRHRGGIPRYCHPSMDRGGPDVVGRVQHRDGSAEAVSGRVEGERSRHLCHRLRSTKGCPPGADVWTGMMPRTDAGIRRHGQCPIDFITAAMKDRSAALAEPLCRMTTMRDLRITGTATMFLRGLTGRVHGRLDTIRTATFPLLKAQKPIEQWERPTNIEGMRQ